jgi:hypothetical protein
MTFLEIRKIIMFIYRNSPSGKRARLAALAGGALLLGAVGISSAQAPPPTAPQTPGAAPNSVPHVPVRTNLANHVPMRALMYYQGFWGVDSLTVKYTESGEIIRFSYRVVDPAKAAALNNEKSEPSLMDPQAGVKLVVPQMEKVGKLRQSSTPIAGKQYWMAFSNNGRRVRKGDRVNVQIGPFQAVGLVVE